MEPTIYLTDWQYATLYLAECERRGTVDVVRAYLDAHAITRVGSMRETIALAREWAEERRTP